MSDLLREKGYVAPVDVMMRIGWLTHKDYERWRYRQVDHLERVVAGNLSKLSFALQQLRRCALRQRLRPLRTVYVSWGKGGNRRLRFSRTGNEWVESA